MIQKLFLSYLFFVYKSPCPSLNAQDIPLSQGGTSQYCSPLGYKEGLGVDLNLLFRLILLISHLFIFIYTPLFYFTKKI
ncbi:MAG: hypothetical protein CR971_00160 [candidate division SR1 bacterium]|nr:MAG: hypothetical protein CR971_00160 [candidate division SR1 bacterium]